MRFLYPLFLFALLAVAIPVIIHLFNFRRYKTIYFSNVGLLKRIKQDSARKSKLKQLFILISRILAITCLVFAFSRPFIPLTERTSTLPRQVVAVYIDNTFSMKAEGENGSLLEQAKNKAIEIANSYRPGTQFLIQTSDLLPEHQYLLNKDQFIQEISKIKDSPQSPRLSEIYRNMANSLNTYGKKAGKTLYILSDFQKKSSDLKKIESDTAIFTYLFPFIPERSNNLVVDSCWFEVPGRKIGQSEKLYAQISNLGDQAYQNIPVRLTINDSLKAISNINLAAKEKTTVELNFSNATEGIKLCKVDLDDYPVIYDNSYFFSYRVLGKLRALGIYNPKDNSSQYLKALFEGDELVEYDESPENNIQISQLKNYQCIFLLNIQTLSSGLQAELKNYIEQGGTLVISPARLADYSELNKFLNTVNNRSVSGFDTTSVSVSEINYDHELYHDVFKKKEAEADLPVIKGSVKFAEQLQKNDIPLLRFRNGNAALSTHQLGDGTIYMFAFPVNQMNLNFIRHIIFVPTIYNMVLNSGPHQQYAYSTDNREPILLSQNNLPSEVTMLNPISGEEYVVPVRSVGEGKKQLNLDDLSIVAGHYLVKEGSNILQSLSFNYPRTESIQENFSVRDLEEWANSEKNKQIQIIPATEQSFDKILRDLNDGKQLWKYCIFMSILFLLAEIIIIRFWK